MWIQFFIGSLVVVGVLIIPGLGLLRLLGFDRLECLCYSPLISIALISLLCVAYGELGVFASWASVLTPLFLLSLVLVAVSRGGIWSKVRSSKRENGVPAKLDSRVLLLYLAVAVAVSGWYFVRTLNGPDSFSQEHDNIHHLLQIKEFVETGDMSTFHVNLYALNEMKGIPTPFPVGASFYPSGWHCIAALTQGIMRCSVALAQNAVIWTFLALVIPLAVFPFHSRLFFNQRLPLIAGSFLSLAFSAFPWQMLIFGPLYPNFGAFCLIPLVVDSFMGMCEEWHERGIAYLVVFLFGGISLAVMHPNSVFSASIILFPYCLLRIVFCMNKERLEGKDTTISGFIAAACFACSFILLWCFLHALPFFRSTTGFSWAQMSPPKDQFMNVLTLSFRSRSAQVLLSIFVLLGLMRFLHDRQMRWLALSYVLFFIISFFCGLGPGDITSLLSGFWYNDLYRVGASMAIVCLPLACEGLSVFEDFVSRIITSLGYEARKDRKKLTTVVITACAVALYVPSFLIPGRAWVDTAFGDIEDALLRLGDVTSVVGPEEESLYYNVSDIFDLDDYLLSQPHELGIMSFDESLFLAEVAELVEEDCLILNQPHDGSVFGNIRYDLNVFYLTTSTPPSESETFESRMVRTGLSKYGTSELVRNAVDSLGAEYVLLLDVDGSRSGTRYWYGHYYENDWLGINAVGDDTPGFEVVLSRGDMRLYRIVR